MRLIVLSDSHGDDDTLRWMLEQAWKDLGPVDAYIHCGDGARDFQRLESFIRRRDEYALFFGVNGNCDFAVPGVEPQRVLTLDGVRIFVTHGHAYHVKSGYADVDAAARERDCTVTLFGHTHKPMWEMRSTLLVNPGSAADGRMAVLEIKGGQPRVELLAF